MLRLNRASQRYAGQEAPHGTAQDRSGFAVTGSLRQKDLFCEVIGFGDAPLPLGLFFSETQSLGI